ncbi:MAG: hypothetical protein KC503_25125 [Myxococcales bacterium]|nr:hypothetical protein [Myxococcales bacterium]
MVASRILLLSVVISMAAGCDRDKRAAPLRGDTALDILRPDLPPPKDVGSDVDGPRPDAYVFTPLTCAEFEKTGYFDNTWEPPMPFHTVPRKRCNTDADCGPTEVCFEATEFIFTCIKTCVPSPTKGGDCAGTQIKLPTPNLLSAGCFKNIDCTSTDASNCPPGSYCSPASGGKSCTFTGPKKLGEACAVFNINDPDELCEYPHRCVPDGGQGTGVCRAPCDTYPGGANTTPCDAGFECFNFISGLGYDYHLCCPNGTSCKTQ